MGKQMELFNEGGLRDEGGTVEPESGNKVPSGSLKKEVADDIPIMINEGEIVFPADVVRYIGLSTLMKMRQDAKQGLKMMEKMGQMGNPEEAEIPDDVPFGMADLVVVSGDMKKEDKEDKEEKAEGGVVGLANGGSLFDDPRFQRPEGDDTPVLDDDEKQEIEDALIGTVYGNITVRRYVNADGVVKYIPFIDDEPQMPIPEGFELDDTAPEPKSNIITSTGDTDRGDDSGGAAFTPDMRSPFDDQGTASFDINNLNNEELVEYYGSFSSPMNKFLSVGVGMLFGGLPALGIAAMQQLGQTRGPNSLVAVEDLIAQKISSGEISGDLLDRLKELQERAKQKGTGPNSFISKLIGGASEGDSEKADTLAKAIKTGAVSTVSKELKGAVDQSVQQALNSALFSVDDDIGEGNTTLINTVGGLVDIARTSTFDSMVDKAPITGLGGEFVPAPIEDYRTYQPETRKYPNDPAQPQTLGVTGRDAFMAERFEPATVDFDTMDMLTKAAGSDVFKTAFGLEDFGKARSSPYEAEGRSQLGSGFKSPEEILYTRGFNPEDMGVDPIQEQEFKDQMGGKTKKRTKKLDKPSRILPRRGEKFTDIGVDMPSRLGQSRVDDFLMGVQRDDKGNISNLTEQQQRAIRDNTRQVREKALENHLREVERMTGDPIRRAEESVGQGDLDTVAQNTAFDEQMADAREAAGKSRSPFGFYVGGVPTKPMKPQRLKKGGLAKPKVKPKRMKKGGLASKKK